jgi:hypothetical protein
MLRTGRVSPELKLFLFPVESSFLEVGPRERLGYQRSFHAGLSQGQPTPAPL